MAFSLDEYRKAKKEGRVKVGESVYKSAQSGLDSVNELADHAARQSSGQEQLWGRNDIVKNYNAAKGYTNSAIEVLSKFYSGTKDGENYKALQKSAKEQAKAAQDYLKKRKQSTETTLENPNQWFDPKRINEDNAQGLADAMAQNAYFENKNKGADTPEKLKEIEQRGESRTAPKSSASTGGKATKEELKGRLNALMDDSSGEPAADTPDIRERTAEAQWARQKREAIESREEENKSVGDLRKEAEQLKEERNALYGHGEVDRKKENELTNKIEDTEQRMRKKVQEERTRELEGKYGYLNYEQLKDERKRASLNKDERDELNELAWSKGSIEELEQELEELKTEQKGLYSKGYDTYSAKRDAQITDETNRLKEIIADRKDERLIGQVASMTNTADFNVYSKIKPGDEEIINRIVGEGNSGGGKKIEAANPFEKEKTDPFVSQDTSTNNGIGLISGGEYANKYMTEDEKKSVIYLYNTQGEEKAQEYYDALLRTLNKRMTEAVKQGEEEYAQEHPVLASAKSVATNLGSGFGIVEDIIKRVSDQRIDDNSVYHLNARRTNAIRGKVAENIDNPTASWLYQTGMSAVVDSAVNVAVAGVIGNAVGAGAAGTVEGIETIRKVIRKVTGWVSSVVMGSQVATQTVIRAKERGLSDGQAVSLGVVYGVIEGLTEKYSIESILSDPKSVVGTLAKAFVSEGSEEVASNVADRLADALISGDKSEQVLRAKELRKQGYSDSQVLMTIVSEALGDDALSFLGGALSGLSIGGLHLATNYGRYKAGEGLYKLGEKVEEKAAAAQTGAQLKSDEGFDVARLIEQAKSSGDEKTVRLAEKLETQAAQGKTISNTNLGVLKTLTDSAFAQSKNEAKAEDNAQRQKIIDSEYSADGSEEIVKQSSRSTTNAFGNKYVKGLPVKEFTKEGKTHEVMMIYSSAREAGAADNTVLLQTKDGSLINAEGATVSGDSNYTKLLSMAGSFDTLGARGLLANFDRYAQRAGEKADVVEYVKSYKQLYDAGRTGATLESIENGGKYGYSIEALGRGVAYTAVTTGNHDSDLNFRAEDNRLQRMRIPGQKNALTSKVRVEEGVVPKASAEQIQILQALAEKAGREIVLTDKVKEGVNGFFDRRSGKIYLNAEIGDDAVLSVALHEVMHGVRLDAPTEFEAVRDFVFNYLESQGKNTERMIEVVLADWRGKISERDDAVEEIVCDTVMALASDEAAARRAIESEQNADRLLKLAEAIRKIAARVKQYIKDFAEGKRKKFAADGLDVGPIARETFINDADALMKLAELFSSAAEKARQNIESYGEKKNEGEGEKYSFAGERARSADLATLKTAKELESQGENSEAIRQKTGWHKGYDGKWRFEIDDSDIEVKLTGVSTARKPIVLKNELFEKFVHGELTEEERTQLIDINNYHPEYIGDIVKHEKLFEAYPQLHGIRFRFKKMSANGYYSSSRHEIVLNEELKAPSNKKRLVKTLAHELQHAVQNIEGFARGTSVNHEYNNGIKTVRENLISSKERLISTAYNQFINANENDVDRDKYDKFFEIIRDVEDKMRKAGGYDSVVGSSGLVELYNETDNFDILKAYQEWTNALHDYAFAEKSLDAWAKSRYFNNAGEIEARDTAVRLDMNAEKRKNTRPDIDREIVEFANPDTRYSVDDLYDPEIDILTDKYSVSDREYLSAVKRGDMKEAQRMVDEAAKTGQINTMQFKRWFGDWQNKPKSASKVVDKDGKPLVVYHQTAADFSVFNTDNPLAGLNDSETPNGIFFKTNDHDIGLEGKKQMPVYLNIRKMLDFKDRAEANQWYRNHVEGYKALDEEKEREVGKFLNKLDELEYEMLQDVSADELAELNEQWHSIIESSRAVENKYRGELRELLNEYFLNGKSGYDGIHLGYDGHANVNGKYEEVETYIVFKNTQVKSATDNIGTFAPNNPDIRYSVDDRAYLSAVKRGDMEAAQRMVDEAAEKAFENSRIRDEDGKLLKVYHGTDADFTVFDKTKGRANMDIQGMFFSPWEIDAGGYGQNVRSFYLNITNPASESTGFRALNSHKGENYAGRKAREDLERMGYDGVNNEDEEYIAFNSNQIKSADAVTYDDAGKIIPLSQRFDSDEEDIRYSVDGNDESFDNIKYAVSDDFFDDFDIDDEDLFGEEPKVNIEDVVKADPEKAVELVTWTMRNTFERLLDKYSSLKLTDTHYTKITERLFRNYSIPIKDNRLEAERFAERIAEIVGAYEKKKAPDMSVTLEELAKLCRDALLFSEITEYPDESGAKKLADILSNGIVIGKYDETEAREHFGSISNMRQQFFGNFNVRLAKPGEHGTSISELIEMVQDEIPLYAPEEFESEWDWIERVTEATKPRVYNPYMMGSQGEDIDSAAIGMAFEVLSEAVNSKVDIAKESGRGTNGKSVNGNVIRSLESENQRYKKELEKYKKSSKENEKQADYYRSNAEKIRRKESELVKAERDAYWKAKNEKYRQALEQEKERHEELKKRYHDIIDKLNKSGASREVTEKYRKRIALLEDENRTQKGIINTGQRTFRQQYIERQEKRRLVENIKRTQARLNSMIMNPTDKRYIPEEITSSGLYEALMDLCESMVIGQSSRLEDMGDLKMWRTSRIAEKLGTVWDKLNDLRKDGGDYADEFDADFMSNVNDLRERLAERKRISSKTLSLEEAREINAIINEIEQGIRYAREQIDREERITNQESGERIINDTREIELKKAKLTELLTKAGTQFLAPGRAMRMLSGYNDDAELMYHYRAINDGWEKGNLFRMRAEKHFSEFTKQHQKEYERSLSEIVEVKYKTNNGEEKTVRMTRMEGLQILMTWEREERSRTVPNKGMRHLRTSGITLANPEALSKGKRDIWTGRQRVELLNTGFIASVGSVMTEFDWEYKKLAEEYFNKISKDAINETMLKLKHRKIATSDYYVPISVDKNFLSTELESLKFDGTIEGRGSYKQIMPDATQPVLIMGLNSVIDRNIKDTASLYGLAIPIRNFKRAYKTVKSAQKADGTPVKADSVKNALEEKFGKASHSVIEKMVTDLESPRVNDSSVFARGLYKARVESSLVMNIGVVIKQAASYPTAGRYLSAGSLMEGLAKFAAHKYGNVIKEIDEHTAQHYIRRLGMSEQEIADMQNSKLNKLPAAVNPVKWIQGVDCLTTAALWEACKAEINSEYKKSAKTGSEEEYWKKVTDLYDKVIEETQPMYDSLHRAEIQKGGGDLRKALFMFKTQPLQNTGILYDAAAAVVMNKGSRKAWKEFGKALASQISSLIVFSGMTLARDLLLHKTKRRKDEEGNLTAGSMAMSTLWDVLSNGLNVLAPYGGQEIYDAITAIFSGGTYNGLDVGSVSFLNNLISQIAKSKEVVFGDYPADKKVKSVIDAVGGVSELLGIPYTNAKNITNSVWSYFIDIRRGYFLTDNNGNFDDEHIAEYMVKAKIEGDSKRAEDLERIWKEELKKSGKSADDSAKKIKDKLRAVLAENEDVKAAAQAELDGDTAAFDRAFEKVHSYGFDEKDVRSAVDKAKTAIKKQAGGGAEDAEPEEETDVDVFEDTKSVKPIKYQLSDGFEAIKRGDRDGYETVKSYLVENGYKTEEQIEKYMSSKSRTNKMWEEYLEAQYKGDNAEIKRLVKELTNVYGSWSKAKTGLEEYQNRKKNK